jgi:hypothetical protein
MAGVVDIVFLIDGSGSMQPCMDALRANIGVFIDGMTGAQSPVRDWRAAVAYYRDAEVDGSDWFKMLPFVSKDATALKAQLQSLEAAGGGDEPESLIDALYKVSNLESTAKGAQDTDPTKWRYRSSAARVVIVFTDATFKAPMVIPEAAGGTVRDLINKIHEQKIQLHLYAPDHGCYEELASADKSSWNLIPGPDYVAGMTAYTADSANFKKVMEALGKSVSKSAEVETL